MTRKPVRKHMVIPLIGGSGRFQQKKRRVNGKKRCSPSLDTVVAQAVKVGNMAIRTPSHHLRKNRAYRFGCDYGRSIGTIVTKQTFKYRNGRAVTGM